jgi:splicing factor 3B subunit 5
VLLTIVVQAKYVGTGSPDTTKDELLLTQHRDTYASILGHQNVLAYMAAAENQSHGRMRLRLLEAMIAPTLRAPTRAGGTAQSQKKDNTG